MWQSQPDTGVISPDNAVYLYRKVQHKGARHGVLIIYGSGYCSALSSALHLSNEISVPIIIPCTNTLDVNRYLIFTRRMVHVAE